MNNLLFQTTLNDNGASAPPPCNTPLNDIPPALEYVNLDDGDSIVITDGTWSGDAPIVYTYQWLRDNVSVPGETTQAIRLPLCSSWKY